MGKYTEFCDEDCNHCKLLQDKNSPMLTAIFNELFETFGNKAYQIVQKHCPNLTCCRECHIDDFCHLEGCTIMAKLDEMNKKIKKGKRAIMP